MSAFLDPLDTRHVGWGDGRPIFMTLAPLRYQSSRLGRTVVIPAETVTDFASVPRLPIVWLATGGRGPRSAVLHDFAYQFGFWLLEDGGRTEVEKQEVDAVFYESLLADPISGAGAFRATEMWAGVRLNLNGGIWKNLTRRRALNPEWSAGGVPDHVEAP